MLKATRACDNNADNGMSGMLATPSRRTTGQSCPCAGTKGGPALAGTELPPVILSSAGPYPIG